MFVELKISWRRSKVGRRQTLDQVYWEEEFDRDDVAKKYERRRQLEEERRKTCGHGHNNKSTMKKYNTEASKDK